MLIGFALFFILFFIQSACTLEGVNTSIRKVVHFVNGDFWHTFRMNENSGANYVNNSFFLSPNTEEWKQVTADLNCAGGYLEKI